MLQRKFIDLCGGLAAAVVVFVAVPAVLVALVGIPLPHPWSWHAVASSRGLFDLLATWAWVGWAACCWPVLRSVALRVRRRDTTVSAGAMFLEHLAARIATAVLVISPFLGLSSLASGAMQPTTPQVSVTAIAPSAGVTETPTPAPTASFATTTEYVVGDGDTLWSIAEDLYGDGDDWEAIAALNLGRVMSNGNRFIDPNLIYVGWVLIVPATGVAPATPTASAAIATPPPTPTRAIQSESLVLGEVPQINARGSATAGGWGTVASASSSTEQHWSLTEFARWARPASDARSVHPGTPDTHGVRSGSTPLPELLALGFGVIGAGALARRVRSLRRAARAGRVEGSIPVRATDAAVDIETLIERFEDAPLLDWFEVANRHLGAGLAHCDDSLAVPDIRLLRVGPDGVDAWLTDSVDWAPSGWTITHQGRIWHLSTENELDDLAAVADQQQPWLPVTVPLGDNERGTWFGVIEPGACLPVIGPEAPGLVRAMKIAQESWTWNEQVVVTTSAEIAAREVTRTSLSDTVDRSCILFVGDPGELPPLVRSLCGVLTTAMVPASDVTIAVDTRGASIHPLGITLRPHVVSTNGEQAIGELIEAAETPPPEIGIAQAVRHPSAFAEELAATHDQLRPGPVEVRLLTGIPRLEGLIDVLEPKRARRATELVAYLALHPQDPVTSDRLRTRVLGSADADAAAKTLFNTAGAARRAMGHQEGEALFPIATKTGHYRLSSMVTSDVGRVFSFIRCAQETEDEEASMALYRAALELVEGEPLAGVLAGYGWWHAEGHAGRISAAIVDAACDLSRLAAASGFFELASWSIERARCVDPYSEALSRAAMRLASTTGDADRLRREWIECQRRIDELDPGSIPSTSTERLYAQLSHRAGTSPDGFRPRETPQANLAAIDAAPRSTTPSAPAVL